MKWPANKREGNNVVHKRKYLHGGEGVADGDGNDNALGIMALYVKDCGAHC